MAVGWWPGDADHDDAAFYAYGSPASDAFAKARLEPAEARWDHALGEALLDWEDVRSLARPAPRRAQLRPLRLRRGHRGLSSAAARARSRRALAITSAPSTASTSSWAVAMIRPTIM